MFKPSFFQRLTGATIAEDARDDAVPVKTTLRRQSEHGAEAAAPEEGELTVDVYQTPDDIVIKTIVAGVKPDELDISITRDMVTIRGARQETREVEDGDYFHKELYWGSFSRTILLPQEIDVDASEASERHGLLTLNLPKLDKTRQTKLKVRSS
jgi:HSP20 family protein